MRPRAIKVGDVFATNFNPHAAPTKFTEHAGGFPGNGRVRLMGLAAKNAPAILQYRRYLPFDMD